MLELGTVLQEPNFAMLHFSSLFALVSFWSLICNAEFDLNSSCLDQLNSSGIIELAKTIKFATKCDHYNSRDLNVQIVLIKMISTQKALKTYNK